MISSNFFAARVKNTLITNVDVDENPLPLSRKHTFPEKNPSELTSSLSSMHL